MKRLHSAILVILLALTMVPSVWAWEIERPSEHLGFVKQRTDNATTNGESTVGLGVHVFNYEENDEVHGDAMNLKVSATTNTREGIAYSWWNRSYSWVDIDIPQLYPQVLMSPEEPYDFREIYIPSSVRFYGGPRSGEYYFMWVCKNGFLWFDTKFPPEGEPEPYSYDSQSIPNAEEPNSFIAPLWKELHPELGGKVIYVDALYITPPGGGNRYCSIISWIDVPDKYDIPQTFQVIIELTRQGHEYEQNRIWFQYRDVTMDVQATIGIEDQRGLKGVNISNEILPEIEQNKAIEIKQWSNCFLASFLTIKLSANDPYSEPKIINNQEEIRGYNVILERDLPDELARYQLALEGTSTLLFAALLYALPEAVWVGTAGTLCGIFLVGLEAVEMYAREQAEAKLFDIDPNLRWAKACADDDVVDACFNLPVRWKFLDQDTNDKDHWLNVTTELTYIECAGDGTYIDTNTISTSTVLTVVRDAGNSLGDPNVRVISPGTYLAFVGVGISPPGFPDVDDYYKFNVASGMGLHLTMKPPNNTNFDLYLYNPSCTLVQHPEKGINITEEISYPTTVGGNWSIRVRAVFGSGIYNLTIDEPYPAPKLTVLTKTTGGSSISGVEVYVDLNWYPSPIINKLVTRGTHTITTRAYFQIGDYAYTFQYWENGHTSNTRTLDIQSDKTITAYYSVEYVPPPPPGCPYVYTWNGTAYVLDNNILGASEVSNGTDVEDYYRLEQTFIPTFQCAWFSLYSMQISEFEHEHSYIDKVRLYAVDHDPNVNVAVTPEGQILTYANPNAPISALDNYGYDWLPFVSTPDNIYYRGSPGDYLLLDFGNIDVSQAAKLVLRANFELKKDECIHVQTLDETGEWTDAAVLRTRNHWSTIILDLADYFPNPDGTLKMRLYFTGIHKIDYIGLDTTPQANITITQTSAFLAVHSTQGDVTLKLLLNDQKYAELVPSEQITLKFILPNTQKTRTFITYTEGHYNKIE